MDIKHEDSNHLESPGNTNAEISRSDSSPSEHRRIFDNAIYSAKDVERILCASERTIRDLPLPWVKFGRGRMVLGEDLLRFIRSQR